MNSIFETRVTPLKGRGLYALRNIKAGEVILEEEPLVSCQFLWNATYKYLACDHCLRPLETAQENVHRLSNNYHLSLSHPECCETVKSDITKCPGCSVLYCSLRCQQLAYSRYHRVLCHGPDHPLNKVCELWKSIHYPPETANIMILARIIATIDQAEDKVAAQDAFSSFCHRTVSENEDLIANLIGKEHSCTFEEIRRIFVDIFPTHAAQWLGPESFLALLSLVALNGQGVGTTAFGRWVTNVSNLKLPPVEKSAIDNLIDLCYTQIDEHVGTFLNNEGSALFSIESRINHSCLPNSESSFLHNNSTVTVKAVKNISVGEEICISYLEECITKRSRITRQRILQESYYFLCLCEKCKLEANDNNESSEEESESESDSENDVDMED